MSVAFKILFLAMLLPLPGSGEGTLEGHGAEKRFFSRHYGFSMSVPVGWGVSTRLDTPVYFYAPPSEKFVQDAIPEGGAVIIVQAHDAEASLGKSAKTAESWAKADMEAFAPKPVAIQAFQFHAESGVSQAVVCSYDEARLSPDERPQHSVAIFWEFNQELFAAHLRYNANDAKGPLFERVFFQTIRSLRPREKH